MDYSKLKRVKIMCEGGKKQSKENIIKSIKNLFNLKNYHYKTIIAGNFWNNNYMKYWSSRNKK